jgi:hypothetical protein
VSSKNGLDVILIGQEYLCVWARRESDSRISVQLILVLHGNQPAFDVDVGAYCDLLNAPDVASTF